MVRVSFEFEPEDYEADDNDPSGLTEEAFQEMIDAMMQYGENVEIRAI